MKPMSLIRKVSLLLVSITFFSSSPPIFPSVETHRVEIRNMKFVPSEIKARKGDTVIFVNKDLVIHNVTEEKKSWASPTISPKDSWTYIVKKDLSYYCSFHPMMKGKIKLKE